LANCRNPKSSASLSLFGLRFRFIRWEQKGIRIGIRQGREQGREEGQERVRNTLRELALNLISDRFGRIPETVAERVRSLDSVDELKALITRAAKAQALSDLML